MWYQRRERTKYGNRRTDYDGVVYHSKKEADYAIGLDLEKKAGKIADWKRQVRIPLDVNGYHICNYYIDFVVDHTDGTTEYVEIKGFQTETWRLKWKLFEALYGDRENVKLTVVR